jgi:hypothetical protein
VGNVHLPSTGRQKFSTSSVKGKTDKKLMGYFCGAALGLAWNNGIEMNYPAYPSDRRGF